MAEAQIPKVNWVPDELAVGMLKELGVPVAAYRMVRLCEFDLAASYSKNTRQGKLLDEDNRARIRHGFQRGLPMKALVAMQCGPLHESLGGLHRLKEMEALGIDAAMVHVVKNLADDKAFFVRAVLNDAHGLTESFDSRLAQSVYACQTLNMTTAAVAKLRGIAKDTIQKHIKVAEIRDACGDMKGATAEQVLALNKLRSNSTVQREMADILSRHHARLTGTDWRQMVDVVAAGRTEADMLASVAAVREQLCVRPSKVRGHKPTPGERLLDKAARFLNHIAAIDDLGCLSADQIVSLGESWLEGKIKMDRMLHDAQKRVGGTPPAGKRKGA